MKRKFSQLRKSEQEARELEYHWINPEDFDSLMSQAEPHTPSVVRLPVKLVENLKDVAKSKGEPEYQVLVRKWIEERLQQESRADAA